MGVPEDLEIAASDDLHGRRDDEDEGQGDDDAREAGDGGEDKVGRNLLRILENEIVTLLRCFNHNSYTKIIHDVMIRWIFWGSGCSSSRFWFNDLKCWEKHNKWSHGTWRITAKDEFWTVTLREKPQLETWSFEKGRRTHKVFGSDGVQVCGFIGVLQIGQGGAEVIVNALAAVVVPLHVQQVGDHVDRCQDTKKSRRWAVNSWTLNGGLAQQQIQKRFSSLTRYVDKPLCPIFVLGRRNVLTAKQRWVQRNTLRLCVCVFVCSSFSCHIWNFQKPKIAFFSQKDSISHLA